MDLRNSVPEPMQESFPAILGELLQVFEQHALEMQRQFPDIYWKWRTLMDLLSKSNEN